MVEPIFRDLLKGKSYKTIFNQIYRLYLKNKSKDEITELSIDIHNLINKIRQSKEKNNIAKAVIVTELEDDHYDVNFLEKESDSMLSLENLKVEHIIDLEILAPPKLKELEILGHIIWHYYERTKGKII
jgi:hypothetical protein